MTNAEVTAVGRSATHTFGKALQPAIRLLEGLGVEGDAHMGVTVKHRSRVAQDPTRPNLRQVHLIPAEFHDELRAEGFSVGACELGENITTRGVDLLELPAGTLLRLGEEAVVEVTGLRNPCGQIEGFRTGLLQRMTALNADGERVRWAGVMGVVVSGGEVRPGDPIGVELPAPPHRRLRRV
ncbi:MOSC domain-containing protein [Streptosporangium sp. NPDC023615]|uniref:MOSC domain-containing protein n=1 Tax=Streptosporangium sp. NPDC023615 TaxID=3154794 RepID=UPI00344ABEA3